MNINSLLTDLQNEAEYWHDLSEKHEEHTDPMTAARCLGRYLGLQIAIKMIMGETDARKS